MSETKRRLLYLTPVMPRPLGNGLAMRAAMMLDALASRFEIDLFVFPVAGGVEPENAFVQQRAARIGGADPSGFRDTHFSLIGRLPDPTTRFEAALAYPKPALSCCSNPASAAALAAWASGRDYAAIQVLRLYLAPLLESLLRAPSRPKVLLDLDDDDADYQVRLAAHCQAAQDQAGAQAAAAEARKYRALAARWFAQADLCLTAAAADRDRLAALYPGTSFHTVPNACFPVAPAPSPARCRDELRLLFVGTLGYWPNADAAIWLIREILPALQRRSPVRVCLDIVGAGAPEALMDLAQPPAVTLHHFVEDLSPLYAAADQVIVPLRLGSGTPIKLLEAFGFRRPVIATRFAAAGLEAVDGEQILLADDPQAIADACVRMHAEPELAARCVERAARLIESRHRPEHVAGALATALSTLSFSE
jgi:glycosyltransferase involved in cell wall biosynthesis